MGSREDFASSSIRFSPEGAVITVSVLFDYNNAPIQTFEEGSPMYYIAKNMARWLPPTEDKAV